MVMISAHMTSETQSNQHPFTKNFILLKSKSIFFVLNYFHEFQNC